MSGPDGTMPSGNRKARDTVFRALFRQKEYVLELYRALCPDDTTATVDDLKIITLENVLAIREYNDLGFLIRDKLMILVEAQSTWSDNMIVRMLLYWLIELQQYIERNDIDLFSTRPIDLPMPELFVIFTGERRDKPDTISLNEKLWGGKWSGDILLNVIYDGKGHDMIQQYVRFTKILTEEARRTPLDLRSAVERTIKRCKDEGILAAFLADHEAEVHNTMQIFTDEFVERAMKSSAYREGERRGIALGERRGMELGTLKSLISLVKKGRLTLDEASEEAQMSVSAFKERMSEYERSHE